MTLVTGYTAAHLQDLLDENIVDGDIVGNDLILTKRDATQVNAGNVRGPQGAQGTQGVPGLQGSTGTQGPQGAQGTQGAPNAWSKLAETVLGADTASIDFSGISQAYDELELVLYGRGTLAAVDTAVILRMNNDSGANYDWVRSYSRHNAQFATNEGVADTSMALSYIAAANAPANVFDQVRILIAAYKNTIGQKVASAQGQFKDNTVTGNLFAIQAAGWWRSTAAINRLTLLPGSGNFKTGTIATLYGRGD